MRRQTLLLELRRRHSTFAHLRLVLALCDDKLYIQGFGGGTPPFYLKYPYIFQYVNFAKWLKTKLGVCIFYNVLMGLYILGVLEIWANDLALITMEK
jgi:hypothetical protein